MTTAGKLLVGAGVVGALAGAGYLVVRYVRRRRAENAEENQAETKAELHPDAHAETDTEDQERAARKSEEQERAARESEDQERAARESEDQERAARKSEEQTEANFEPPAEHLPDAPLAEPAGPNAHVRINRSTTDDEGTVQQSAEDLLRQARAFDADITLDELTAARLAASEHSRGTFTELCCIIDAEVNRAQRRKKSLFHSLTYNRTFGRQNKKRRASTRQDPRMRHLWAARAVLSGKARGIARGAKQFFDPRAMNRMHAKYRAWVEGGRQGKAPPVVSCDALTLLEAWSFDYGKIGGKRGPRCPPDRSKRGRHTLAWVGEIPGVDPWRLMLMKRLNPGQDHAIRYHAARRVIEEAMQREAEETAAK